VFVIISICLAIIGLTSCTNGMVLAVETTPESIHAAPNISVTKIITPSDQPTETDTPIPLPTAESEVLPPEPQPISFNASDGTVLNGYYYPAAVNPAPMVVMMHWAGDDMSAWYELAVWLQNRGQINPFQNPGTLPWWDPTWFPQVPADKSYGVFIFTFRGCNSSATGCLSFNTTGWLDDAQSAMLAVRELEGVDPDRIVAVGSSIGGDGAVDGCLHLHQKYPGSCKGAFSLSPNNYLNIKYERVIEELGKTDPPISVWCVAAPFQFETCKRAQLKGNPAYMAYQIPDGSHGTGLLRPGLEPLPIQLMLDFLDTTLSN